MSTDGIVGLLGILLCAGLTIVPVLRYHLKKPKN